MENKSVSHIAEKTAFIIAIIIYIVAVLSLAYISDVNIFVVFIGTLPTLLYLIVFFYFVRIDSRMALLWVLPLVFPLLFLALWYSGAFGLKKFMDGPVASVLNILISYLVNIFVLFIFGIGTKRDTSGKDQKRYEQNIGHVKEQLNTLKSQLEYTTTELHETKDRLIEAKKEIVISKENFNISLRSIEDKCKAINFVIGRVYSDKKGANESIREKLRISSDLYNSFSEITTDFKAEDAERLHHILENIHRKLLDLELPENRMLRIGKASLHVERDPLGSDRILDVLKMNDKDPIMDYHAEAKEICSKLISFLTENYIKSNTYFTE
jgi:hypothetical protein